MYLSCIYEHLKNFSPYVFNASAKNLQNDDSEREKHG